MSGGSVCDKLVSRCQDLPCYFDAPLIILFHRFLGKKNKNKKHLHLTLLRKKVTQKGFKMWPNSRCSFPDLLVWVRLYIWGVSPVSEGTPHSFKIKLTRGKTCPFLQRRGRTGRALCRCCGHALTHIISGWTQTSRRLDTPYFPFLETKHGAKPHRLLCRKAKQCRSSFLWSSPSAQLKDIFRHEVVK